MFVDIKHRTKSGKNALDVVKDEQCKLILQQRMNELDDQALQLQREMEKETKPKKKKKPAKTTPKIIPEKTESPDEELPQSVTQQEVQPIPKASQLYKSEDINESNWETVGKKKKPTGLSADQTQPKKPVTISNALPTKQKITSVWDKGTLNQLIQSDVNRELQECEVITSDTIRDSIGNTYQSIV